MTAERYHHSPAEHHFPPLPENTASLYLGEPVRSVRWSDDGIHEGPTSKGDVTVKTAGRPVGWYFDGDVGLLVVRFAPAFLGRVAQENGLDAGKVELRPSQDRRDRPAPSTCSTAPETRVPAGLGTAESRLV